MNRKFPSPNLGLSLKSRKENALDILFVDFRPLIWGYL